VLRFEGPDAQAFLQGQLTNDVAALSDTRSQYSGYCNPKGRLLTAFLLWQREGAYYAMLPRELCEPIRKRLAMYILRAKVKALDVSAEHVLFGLSGTHASALLAALGVSAPAAPHVVVHGANLSVIRLPVDRCLIIAAATTANEIQSQLAAHACAGSETLWRAHDIAAGVPQVLAATQEQFVPQTVNFDLIHAVSFDKGCYPGQEIVARTRYLGRVKQRMVRASLQSTVAPAPGDKLYSAAFGDQASGMVVSVVSHPPDQHELLAVVQAGDIGKATVHWQARDGPPLQISTLPYPIE